MVKPGYKATEIGAIPTDWEICYLNDLGDVVSGGTPKTTDSECWNGDIAWCTPSDITSTKGKYISCTERLLTDKGLKNSAATLMPANSLLLCTRATIGELKICTVPMATNQGFKNLRSNGHANVDFLYYLLQTKREKMYELAIGSTFLEISKSAICRIPLQCPSLEEQQKIAEVLSDMDGLITSLEKLIAKKNAIKQGAMQELLTGKKRLPGFDGEWLKHQYKDICQFINGRAYSQQELLTEGKYKVLRLGNLFTNEHWYYTDLELPEKQYCNQGDLIYAWSATFGPRIWLGDKVVYHYHIWKVQCSELVNKTFLYHYFMFDTKEMKQELQGGTMSHLTKDTMENRFCRIPELKEQQAIASILSDMDAEIETLQQKLAKCQQTKQGMMQQLLTGRIRLV